jgi:predicted phage tail component-like protein
MVTTLNYDGTLLDFFINKITKSLVPNLQNNSVKIPNKKGSIFLNNNVDSAIITLDIVLYEDTFEDFENLRRSIVSDLYKTTPKPLIFSNEPDKYIDGILDGDSVLDTLAMHGTASLKFLCPDPCWYAITPETFNFTGLGNHNFTRVKGNIPSLPLIKITGVGSELLIHLNGTEINYSGSLSLGETLYIDCLNKSAYTIDSLGNTLSVIDSLDSLYFPQAIMGLNSFYVLSDFMADTLVEVDLNSCWL